MSYSVASSMADTSQVDSPRVAGEPRKQGSAWPLYAILIAFVGGGVFVCVAAVRIEGIADEYLALVREGRLDDAYEMVAPSVQATTDRTAFAKSAVNARLRRAEEASWNYAAAGSNGQACAKGTVRIDGEKMRIRVFLMDTEAGWRIHTVQVYDGLRPRGPWSCSP